MALTIRFGTKKGWVKRSRTDGLHGQPLSILRLLFFPVRLVPLVAPVSCQVERENGPLALASEWCA